MSNWYTETINPVDQTMVEAAWSRQGQLTKPPGSLGQLESIAVQLSGMQGTLNPAADHVEIAVFAADHGVVAEGVSAFPQVVTGEMVKNFVNGGAAISVLASQLGAGLTVVNAGTIAETAFDDPVVHQPVSQGTGNIAIEPAMGATQLDAALDLGKQVADQYTDSVQILVGGEMGIGNTTSATALCAAFGVASAAELVGPGTGLDSNGVSAKLLVIEKALRRAMDQEEPREICANLGGYEILALSGFYLRAAQRGIAVLVDGFIASAAAVAACHLNPDCRQWMIFSHASAEPGHRLILQYLEATPVLQLDMRLGEGSGAAVAVNVLRSACALHSGMATFAEAGVSTDG